MTSSAHGLTKQRAKETLLKFANMYLCIYVCILIEASSWYLLFL